MPQNILKPFALFGRCLRRNWWNGNDQPGESELWEDLNLDNSFWKLIFNDFSDLFPAIAALLAISISLSAVFLDNFLSFSRNNDNTNSGRNYKIPLWKMSRLVWPKKYFCPCATKKILRENPRITLNQNKNDSERKKKLWSDFLFNAELYLCVENGGKD